MKRETLKEQGLTDEQVDLVMAEYGKGMKLEQEKSSKIIAEAEKESSLVKEKITGLEKQIADFQEQVKGFEGVDEKAKAQIEEATKSLRSEYEEKVSALEAEYKTSTAKIKREADTEKFFTDLGKTFSTPETRISFIERMNVALTDQSSEGMSRADIFAKLAQDKDGKERSDIFLVTEKNPPPAVTAESGSLQAQEAREAPKII